MKEGNILKKLISLLAVILICLSLCACGVKDSSAVPTETQLLSASSKEDAIQTFKNYIMDNSIQVSGAYMYTVETGLKDVNIYVLVSGDVVSLSLVYKLGRMTTENIQFQNTTIFYLSGYENQQPGTYYLYQKNASTMNSTEFSLGAGVNLDPAEFTVDSNYDFVDIKKTENNANAVITDAFTNSARDGLNTILEELKGILDASGLNLTLADFGFHKYIIDENRQSDIRSEAWAKAE